jgi:hypothetical protein
MTELASADEIIPVKSPLAITGGFPDIIRRRFKDDCLPWQYLPGDDMRSESSIHIEAGQIPETEDFGRRPAIYINRGPISISQTGLGDKITRDSLRSTDLYYAIAQTQFTFSVEAEQPAEAEIIADIVLSTLFMGSDPIERTFNFRKLGPFAMSARAKTRQDTEITQVSVTMGLTYDVRWVNRVVAPLLSELVVNMRESSYTNGDDYFVQIYQSSLADSPNSTN